MASPQTQVTIQDLLLKIGSLTIELDVARSFNAQLEAKNQELWDALNAETGVVSSE